MKIKVKNIVANPYRKIEHYPIDKAKVDALKTSIKEKTWWDNVLLRPHPTEKGKYQLAYGHHRWFALQELGLKEIDVPVRDIGDATMLQIMAEENLNWSTSPAIMTQTILTAKEFLDGELAKYETLATSGEITRCLFKNQTAFAEAKTKGVGRDTLVKFLGGNWTEHAVRVALDIIKDKDLDTDAIKTIPTMEQAKVFRTAVKKNQIPKATQKRIAEKIAKEGVGKRDIPELVAEHRPAHLPAKKEPKKELPMLDDVVKDACASINKLRFVLNRISGHMGDIRSAPLRDTFLRDGQELLSVMKEIFEEQSNEKEEKTKKSVLSKSS